MNKNKTAGRTVTLAKGGTGERTVEVASLQIPGLWHIATHLRQIGLGQAADDVLEVWHIAHDLKRELTEL